MVSGRSNLNPHECVLKGLRASIPPDRRVSKGIELLASIVRYQSKAKIKRIFERSYPETSSRTCAGEFPQELVDMIVAHVILDTPTLKAVSATCRSWYIAALPHLHHTLTLCRRALDPGHQGLIPLQKLGKMGLLPFVKRLLIVQYHGNDPSLPTVLNARSPVYFAFTNVQELAIDMLALVFTPRVHLYFGHSMPKLRSLALRRPLAAHHQLLYFIGLFPNLEDFKLADLTREQTPEPVPVPQSVPPLRGRLTLRGFCGVDFLRDLSKLSGGLRFRYAYLREVEGARFLLENCAETLETLRVYPSGQCALWVPVLSYLTYGLSEWNERKLRDFNLSKNRSLRSLEVTVDIPGFYSDHPQRFLRDLLSTITSSVFSEVVIILGDGVIHHTDFFQQVLFRVVRGMYEVKPFRLVFCLEIWDGDREDNTERLRRYIDAEAAKGGLNFLPCSPIIVSNTRAMRSPEWGA